MSILEKKKKKERKKNEREEEICLCQEIFSKVQEEASRQLKIVDNRILRDNASTEWNSEW